VALRTGTVSSSWNPSSQTAGTRRDLPGLRLPWHPAHPSPRIDDLQTRPKERGYRSLVLDAPIGSTFAFDVEIEGFVFPEQTDTLFWTGRPQAATFQFHAPESLQMGTARRNGLDFEGLGASRQN
jgi:hypothetical protein